MMQTIRILKLIVVGVAATFTILACGGDGVDTSLDTPTTRVRTLDKIQAVFDLMPKSAHDDMMEMMGGPDSISHGDDEVHDHHAMHAGDSHFVMLTLMDVGARGAAITDADVEFHVRGPDGKTLTRGGHIMSGKGMHHYAVGFPGAPGGAYEIETKIARAGKTYTQSVEFEIGAP
jgi:hypothetical protein